MDANVVRKLTWRIMNCPQIAQIKKPAHKSGKKKGEFYHEGHEEHEEFVNRDSLRVLRVLRGKKHCFLSISPRYHNSPKDLRNLRTPNRILKTQQMVPR